jgi:hypothetical protein
MANLAAQKPHMTELLKKAVEKFSEKFAEHEQDEFARWLLDAIEADDDRRWDAALADPANGGKLSKLVNEALEDIREGRTEPLDPNKL